MQTIICFSMFFYILLAQFVEKNYLCIAFCKLRIENCKRNSFPILSISVCDGELKFILI